MTSPDAAPLDQNDIAQRLHALRPTLMRLAQLQLRNAAWAEDAVSETLLAAIEGSARFAGQSQFKTWVVGAEPLGSEATGEASDGRCKGYRSSRSANHAT
jgi:hypothetical protein